MDVSTSLVLRSKVCATKPGFLCDCWESNIGLVAYVASTFLIESSPQPLKITLELNVSWALIRDLNFTFLPSFKLCALHTVTWTTWTRCIERKKIYIVESLCFWQLKIKKKTY